jgi:hypothetical protein
MRNHENASLCQVSTVRARLESRVSCLNGWWQGGWSVARFGREHSD